MKKTTMIATTGLRAAIEGFAARYAAMRVREGSRPDQLLALFRAMQQAAEANDHRGFVRLDRRLHHAIVRVAGVSGLERVWRDAFNSQNPFRERSIKRFWPDLGVLFEWHRPLVDAIAAGDSHAAEDAAIAHLDAVWYRMGDTSGDRPFGRDPLFRACAYLAFHFGESIRLPTLASQIAGCSAGHLARLFRERQGLNFRDYLIEIRMHKAADLLKRTRLEVQRVALRVGYRDPSRFSIHFRRRYGRTPSAFRRRYPLAPEPSSRAS